MLKAIRRLKVGQRIIVGFMIMLVLLVSVSMNGLLNLSKMNQETDILGFTALAKYHTLVARYDVDKYQQLPNEQGILKVNDSLDEAIANAESAKSLMISADNQKTMLALVEQLHQFKESFNQFVILQNKKEEAEALRAAAVIESEAYISTLMGIQDNIILNARDVEASKAGFETYKLAIQGYEDFIQARAYVNAYIGSSDESIFQESLTHLTASHDNFTKAKASATDPSFGIYANYALGKIEEYQGALEQYRELSRSQSEARVLMEKSALDISSIADQGEAGVSDYISQMRVRAVLIVILFTALSVVLGFVSTILISQSIRIPLREYIVKLNDFGKGDLTVRFNQEGKDELSEMGHALSQMEQSLGSIIHEVIETANRFKAISHDAIERTNDNNQRIEGELSMTLRLSSENEESLGDVSLAIEEISKGTVSSAHAASESVEAATTTKGISEKVAQDMGLVDEEIHQVGLQAQKISMKMQDVSLSVHEISSFVKRISEIASQTNLLALNAAIEAARAGEQGKGFSVVADEVRKLAEESNVASKEISRVITLLNEHSEGALNEIKASEESISRVVSTTSETKSGMRQSLDEIEKLSMAMESIAAVTQEQAASSEEILATTETVMKATNDVVANIDKVNGIAKASSLTTAEDLNQITKSATDLVELLGYFSIGD